MPLKSMQQSKWMFANKPEMAKDKMAFKIGYRVIGVRNFKQSILLECLLEFDDGK